MNKFFTALTTLVFVSLAMPVGAEECVPVTENPEVDTDRDAPGAVDAAQSVEGGLVLTPGHHQYYVDNDFCQLENCGFSIWIYEESNGVAGLQRNDQFSGDRTCGLYDGDTIIF